MHFNLFAVLCLASAVYPLQDHILDNNMGWHNQAFSSGGNAEQTGVNALFSNPAGLKTQQGFHIQGGGLDLVNGFSPLAAFGQNVSRKVSYGLGYFYNLSRGPDSLHQGVTGGFSIHPIPPLAFGAAVFTQSVGGEAGLDMNAGVQYIFSSWVTGGFRVKNINESRLGPIDSELQGIRRYTLSAAIAPLHPFSGFYDIHAADVFMEDISHSIAIRWQGGEKYRYSMVHSYAAGFAEEFQLRTGFGFELGLKADQSIYSIAYSIGEIPLSGPHPGVSQALTMNIKTAVFRDMTPPSVVVTENSGRISPAGNPPVKQVFFNLSVDDETSDIAAWHFVICSTDSLKGAKETLRHFAGRGLPPKTILWDCRNSARQLLEPGFYAYRLVAEDAAGNIGKSRWRLIEVGE